MPKNSLVKATESEKKQIVAARITEQVGPKQAEEITRYLNTLLEIRSSDRALPVKVAKTVSTTVSHRNVFDFLKAFARVAKLYIWDSTSLAAKMAVGAAAATAIATGGAAAGLAALGTAISVPLWIVAGGGASFAGLIIQELRTKYNIASSD